MVENKHSINTILSFGAKSVNPEILESLLTGRDKTADFLEKKVQSIVENGDNQFILVIGQRGMGKTHLLKVLHSRIWHYTAENKLKIAYFAEEEYGVANFFDFLLRILNSFIKWYEKDEKWLQEELENLQETSSANQLNYLEKIIKLYIKNNPLLIITENFGDILEQMGQEEQGRLRAWLYENTNVSIIASSQSVSDNFDREDRPFYGFFTPYYLKNLSFEESYSFLISLAEIEKDDKLVEHLKTKGKPQVRAIFDLVKGNHRLLVTFYHFLKTDMLAKVSETFIKTINDLKPYYETYIRYLPAQQQKILRYIALARKPQLGVEISKNCFIEQKSLSKQLSELSRKKLIEAITNPNDKRNKFYDISEPLLRISIEVGEHKEGITSLFIDFLAFYYGTEELIERKSKFENLINYCKSEIEKREINYEIEAIKKAINIKKNKDTEDKILIISDLIKKNKITKAKKLFFEIFQEDQIDFNLFTAYNLSEIKKLNESIEYFRKVKISNIIDNNQTFKAYLVKYSTTLLDAYFKDENKESLLYECVQLTSNYSNLKETLDEYIVSRAILSYNLINENKLEEAEKFLKDIINLDFNSYIHDYKHFITELISKSLGNDNSFILKYKNYIQSLPIKEKIKTFTNLSKIGKLENFKLLHETISINSNLKSVITNWIINILINENNLTNNDMLFLKDFIETNKHKIPELKIAYIYVETYQKVVINKNESALYELPKEQREFFEQKILKRK